MKDEVTKLCMESYNQGINDEIKAMLMTIEALYDSEDPTPMYQAGYNHALSHMEEFIIRRTK